MALAGVSTVALQHRSGSEPIVLVPQTTTPVTCGQTITVSIVIGNDLNCPSTVGLAVGHASITINLNGHTLAGNTGHYGIDGQSFSAVTLTNGTLSGWGIGVASNGAAVKVSGIRATGNSLGMILVGTGSSATANVVFLNSVGINADGPNIKVTSNVVRENSGDGITVGGAGVVVQTNQSESNGSNGIRDGGIGTILTGNVSNANGSDGISSTTAPTATVASNTANYNGSFGIEASPGGKDGGLNKAKGNTQATQCKDVVCA